MSNRLVLALFAGTLFSSIVRAEEPKSVWIEVVGSSSFLWHAKKESGGLITVDKKKDSAYRYVYQKKDKKKNTFEYGKVFVDLNACRQGYGYVYYNDMAGEFKGKDAFVRFGSTVADHLGSMACSAWDSDTRTASREDKGGMWEQAAFSDETGTKFFIKTDTVRKRSHNGKPAVAALYADDIVKEDRVKYGEYVIATSDCGKGFGTIYDLDFSGVVMQKYDVALGGSSIISAIATRLCKTP